jgi:hypothetical protein
MNSIKSIIVEFVALINDTRGDDGAQTYSAVAKVGAGGALVMGTGGVVLAAGSSAKQGEKTVNTQQTAIDNVTKPIAGSGGSTQKSTAPNPFGQAPTM